jgi:predicted MFS family arabinose efflux permease
VLSLAGLAAFFVSLDGQVLVLALPAIAADFRTPIASLTTLGSALALGTLAGLPIAMLADRVGRRRLLVAGMVGFSLANLASAWSPGLVWLAGARVVAVCFETVAGSVAVALVIEEVAGRRRGLALAAITVAAGAGAGLTTLLYPLLAPHWRVLYLLGGGGLPAALLVVRLLPESREWAAAAARQGDLAAGSRTTPLALLLRPPWRRRLLVVATSGALGALLYGPIGLLVALFGSRQLALGPTEISAVVVVSGIASVPAFLLGGRLSDMLGRRWPGVALSLLTVCFAAATFAGGERAYWAGNVLWSICASAAVPVLGAWFGELFPTRARVTSESVAAVASALGGAAGFQLVGLLQAHLGLGPSLIATAAGALLGAGLLLLLPETAGRPLEA